jgi:hypothetical protein
MKRSNEFTVVMGPPLIGGFAEKQYEMKSPACSGITAEGLASPSGCNKTAKITSDEGL